MAKKKPETNNNSVSKIPKLIKATKRKIDCKHYQEIKQCCTCGLIFKQNEIYWEEIWYDTRDYDGLVTEYYHIKCPCNDDDMTRKQYRQNLYENEK